MTGTASAGALLLAAALPVLFLHRDYQPSLDVSFAGTTATAYLSDFAVLAVVLAAGAAALARGLGPLRAGRPLWVAGGLFLAWVAFEVAHGGIHSNGYARSSHAVTAAKFAEYALLAPALVLLVRRRADLLAVLWSLTLWCSAATAVAFAQFFGANVALANLVGKREASFLGYSDYAALSVAVALVGIVALAAPRLGVGRPLGVVATVAGSLGTILAGALAAVLGLVTAAAVLAGLLLLRRRPLHRGTVAAAAATVLVVLGGVAIRGNDLEAFARFTGVSTSTTHGRASDVQTYSQRSLLAWIGYRIWRDHPLLGVGWEGSAEPANFEPVLPAAHRRFPDVAPLAFPAPGREYGVQSSWVQALADLGVVGFALWLGVFASAAWVAARRSGAPALLGLLGTAALVWLWAAQGFYAGIPLDAATAILFGLGATRMVDA